ETRAVRPNLNGPPHLDVWGRGPPRASVRGAGPRGQAGSVPRRLARASDPQFKAPLLRSPAGHRAFARSSDAAVTLRHPWSLAVCSDSGWGLGLRPVRGNAFSSRPRRIQVTPGKTWRLQISRRCDRGSVGTREAG